MEKKEKTVSFWLALEVNRMVDKWPLGSRALERVKRPRGPEKAYPWVLASIRKRDWSKEKGNGMYGFAQKGGLTKQNPTVYLDCQKLCLTKVSRKPVHDKGWRQCRKRKKQL